ncbi:MAG: F0F1 ATP synthase subunit gamma, partial [Candidatus Aminicenantales bacterium]
SRGRAHPLLEAREEQRAIYVVITSDKGLCGAFNANLLATGLEHLEEKSRTCRIQLVLVGKKAVQFFRAKPFSVVRMLSEQPQETAREAICDLVRFLIEEYTFCRTDAVYVLYNEFKSILSPHIVLFKLLPVEFPREREDSMIPDWEPGMTDFLQAVLPEYIEVQLVHFFAESVAAEHAARMMAMDSATQNAEDLITDLTLVLNKIRQASITKELLEIMTAVEALAKK